MNSTDLIGEVKKRFDELQGESSFEDSLKVIIEYWIQEMSNQHETDSVRINYLHTTLPYQLQQIKELHWRSFYLGWLEGRIDLLNK